MKSAIRSFIPSFLAVWIMYGRPTSPEAKQFFQTDTIEAIVKRINLKEEGGDGRADEFIQKYIQFRKGRY